MAAAYVAMWPDQPNDVQEDTDQAANRLQKHLQDLCNTSILRVKTTYRNSTYWLNNDIEHLKEASAQEENGKNLEGERTNSHS